VTERFFAMGTRAAAQSRLDADMTPAPGDLEAMVSVLESRHGTFAADVAEFFATFHSLKGDAGRSWAWAGVAELARRRAEVRQSDQ
jgi:hypothetical protein